jgi:hypothetical protein
MLEMDRIEKMSVDGPERRAARVRDAWRAQFVKRPSPIVAESYDAWVEEVFDDHVVVHGSDSYYSYPYTMDGNDVEFGEPTRVELERRYVPV